MTHRIDGCDYSLKKIGTTVAGRRGVDDNKTLKEVGFVIGDYLDIAVSPPPSGGIVGGGGGPRGGGQSTKVTLWNTLMKTIGF